MLNIDLSKATGAITERQRRRLSRGRREYISVAAWNGLDAVDQPTGRRRSVCHRRGISNYAARNSPQLRRQGCRRYRQRDRTRSEAIIRRRQSSSTLLSTAEDPRAIAPTKENFTKAFEAARAARPTTFDRLSRRHGILCTCSDMYCYLTRKRGTTDTAALSIQQCVSRKRSRAKSWSMDQADTGAQAGGHARHLCAGAPGAVETRRQTRSLSDAIRAIDRARTARSYILMAAPRAVSYEASQYGQVF